MLFLINKNASIHNFFIELRDELEIWLIFQINKKK